MNSETSTTDSSFDHSPQVLTRFRYRVSRWDNTCPDTGLHLVPTSDLAGINMAIDRYVTFLKDNSLPTPSPAERLLPGSIFGSWLDFPGRVLPMIQPVRLPPRAGTYIRINSDHPLNQLAEEFERLALRWPQLCASAARRLGKQSCHLPQAAELWDLFSVTFEILDEVTTSSVLGKFSVLEKSAKPEDSRQLLEVIDWEKKRAEIDEKFKDGALTELEYQTKLGVLETEKKVDEIVKRMSEFI